MNHLLTDLRVAARHLAARPVMTAAAAACVAIGIGSTTTIFSLANGVLFRPLPGIPDPAPLIEVGRDLNGGLDTLPYPVLSALREQSAGAQVAGWNLGAGSIAGSGEPQPVLMMQVTDNYFDVLGVVPQLGREFSAEESRPGSGTAAVVISDALWRRQFAADPQVVGREVRFNGVPATILGVAPPGFGGTWSILRVDVWVPYGMQATGLISEETMQGWRNHFILGVGRLREGADVQSVSAEFALIETRLLQEHPEELHEENISAAPLRAIPTPLLSGVTLFVGALMAVVGLVLLVACVNVAGMLLAAATARRREIAVRLALGATRARLARQLLAETLLLFGLGGSLGVVLAVAATRLLLAFDPPLPPPFDLHLDLSVDLRVMAFALAMTGVTGMVFGLAPALRASRPDLLPALKDEPVRVARLRGRSLLVAAQAAMTVLLVVVSALFLRALGRASEIAIGFDPDPVYTIGVDMDLAGLHQEQAQIVLRELRAGIETIPGVAAIGMARVLPLGLPERLGFGAVRVAGFEAPEGSEGFDADANVVTPGYFAALRLPLAAGREFDDGDATGGEHRAVINERMANRFWGSPAAAVGQTFELDSNVVTVIGVAADARYSTLLEEPPLFVYLPVTQRYISAMNLLVRIEGEPATTLEQVRRIVHRVAPDMPVLDVMPLRQYVELSYLPQRVAASVAGVLGLVALLLAATGMYGVTSQMAASRMHEVGIRMAVGADRRDVLRLLMRQGMTAPLVGLLVGTAAAAAVSGLLESLLFGISGLDPVAFALGVAAMCGAAFLANLTPARWAADTDPVRVLRKE